MSAQINTPISRGKVDSVTELPTTETVPTNYCVVSTAVRSPLFSPVRAAGSGLAPAACQLSSAQASTAVLHLSEWAPLWRVGREREWVREHNGAQDGREERETSSFHILVVERKRGRERYGWRGLWQCWMFPLWSIFHHQHIFFPSRRELTNISLENIDMLEELKNLFSTECVKNGWTRRLDRVVLAWHGFNSHFNLAHKTAHAA